jgi:N-acetyl-anhydromuramyl-L-alanine amidase AmpD
MEGSLQAGLGVLDGARQASWHFSISKTGQVYQHVDTDQIAWTNGSREANTKFWGIECEGVAGEALTELQFQALVQVMRWLWETHQVGTAVRQETLHEHNEMTRFGASATSCPSGRIPWTRLINELEGDDMAFTPEEERALRQLITEHKKGGNHFDALSGLFKQVRGVDRMTVALDEEHKPGGAHHKRLVNVKAVVAQNTAQHQAIQTEPGKHGSTGGGLKRGDKVELR